MKKNFIWNVIGAGANAFVSLVLAIIVTRINGLDEAGIFSYCFATACLMYCIGVYAGRIFQVTDLDSSITDYDFIYNRILTCLAMIIISILFAFINPNHTVYKAIILVLLCLFKDIEAFSEVLYGIVQKADNLFQVGISMTIKAIVSIIIFVIIDILTKNLIISCTSIFIVNIFFIITYDYRNIKKLNIKRNKFNNKSNKLILKTGFYTFILSFLMIYVINICRYTINNILTDDLQTIFGIIIMPATFMGLLGQFIIQPFLVRIKKYLEDNKNKEISKLTINLSLSIIGLGIIILIIAYFLAVPVLNFVYGININIYKFDLMIILIGAVFYGLAVIYSAVLVAMRKTLNQVIIYIVVSIVGTIISYPLINKLGIKGASITYFISMYTIAVLFGIIIKYKLSQKKKNK